MKRNLLGTSWMCLLLALACCMGGCSSNLPKPENANGTINPSVAVAEGAIAYANAANYAMAYVSTCHANMATIGCSENTITSLKAAGVKADAAVKAAIGSVKSLPAGATGIDLTIAEMNAAIAFLQALTPKAGGAP